MVRLATVVTSVYICIEMYIIPRTSVWYITIVTTHISYRQRDRRWRLMAKGNKSPPCGTRPLRPKTRLKAIGGVRKCSWVITLLQYVPTWRKTATRNRRGTRGKPHRIDNFPRLEYIICDTNKYVYYCGYMTYTYNIHCILCSRYIILPYYI